MKYRGRFISKLLGAISIAVASSLAQAAVVGGDFETSAADFEKLWVLPNSGLVSLDITTKLGTKSAKLEVADAGGTARISQSLSLGAGTYDLDFWINGSLLDGLSIQFGAHKTDLSALYKEDADTTADGWMHYFWELIDLPVGDSSLTFLYASQVPSSLYLDNVAVSCVDCDPPPTNGVPEPGSLALVGAALLAGAFARRRKTGG